MSFSRKFTPVTLAASLFLFSTLSFAQGPSYSMSQDERYFHDVALKWGTLAQQKSIQNEQPAVLRAGINAYQNDYRLGPQDQLTINIPNFDLVSPKSIDENYKPTNYEITVQVGQDGYVTIPSFGTFNVNGMTVSQFSNMLKEMAGVYLVKPQAFVTLKKSRPFTIGVLGEVAHPGLYQVSVGEGIHDPSHPLAEDTKTYSFQTDYFPRVSSAIKRAGGILTVSDLENVQVKNDETGRNLTLNLREMILEGNLSQDILLEPGDVVSIPKNINALNTLPEISASTLSPDRYPIRILGFVNRGGVGQIELDSRSLTVANALNEVTIDPTTNLKKVVVLRKQPDTNKYMAFKVDATKEDFQLQPDDTVLLNNRKSWAKMRDFAQAFISPAATLSWSIGTWR